MEGSIETKRIWGEMREPLLSYIRRRVATIHDAEDILQDVFVKIHERIGTLQDSNRLQSWVYQITRNAVIDHYRAHRATEELPETLSAPEADASEEIHRELAGCMRPFIETLPDEFFWDFMPHDKMVAHKERSLDPAHPSVWGTNENPDGYMQGGLAQRPHYHRGRRGGVCGIALRGKLEKES